MKKRYFSTIVYLCLAVLLAGCSKEEESLPIIMVDSTENGVVYSMDVISQGEVLLTKKVSCDYVQTEDQMVSFTTGGKIVDKVYVKVGDQVEVGDLLLTLDNGDILDEIARLEYEIKRITLQRGYLDKQEEFAKESEEWVYKYEYQSPESEEEVSKHNHKMYLIEEEYAYKREDYSDDIDFYTKKLSKLKKEYDENKVYANLAGKVIDIKADLEGSVARKDDVIMSIVDNDSGLFEMEDKEVAKFFTEGQSIPMNIIYGSAKGEYLITPFNMNEWGDKQQFKIVDSPQSATLEVGVSGTVTATIDRRENVLRIPNKALYEADGKYYTYVLNDENMREARFIEIGLCGDNYSEVLDGIELGMKVVSR